GDCSDRFLTNGDIDAMRTAANKAFGVHIPLIEPCEH
ncbi:MAG: Unknown protein, partial [uncultured Thiotrichaceae bacterium]